MARLKSKRVRNNSIKDRVIQIILWVILIISVIIFLWSQNNMVTTDSMIFKVEGLPKSFVGYKIVHVSDLCNSSLNIVDDIKKLDPDVIILSGGYCDSNGKADKTVKQVEKLCKIADVYYVYNKYEDDVLEKTDAINLTCNNVILEAEDFDTEDFIKEVYGDSIIKKANKNNKEALEYIDYITEALIKSEYSSINLIGIDNYDYKNGEYDALDYVNSMLECNESEYTIGITGNLKNAEEISKSNLDMLFSSGTFGTNLISDEYKKGSYGINGTQLFLTGGIGKNKEVTRFINFPQIQCITLSDGSIVNKNPLEKIIGTFVDDVGTIFDNDGGFKDYKYNYQGGEEQKNNK